MVCHTHILYLSMLFHSEKIGVHGSACVYEHGDERGYGVSKYFPPVPRRRFRVLLYCGTAAIQPGELYEIIVLIQLEK